MAKKDIIEDNVGNCPWYFFSLPTQEFFRGQGKIKVGTGMDKTYYIDISITK